MVIFVHCKNQTILMKNLFLLAFVGISLLVKGQNDTIKSLVIVDGKPFLYVQDMPHFIGGEAEMMRFIGENTLYPDSAVKYNIEGKVIVQFIVSSTGEVKDPVIINNVKVGYGCEEEAIRVIMKMPRWTPGYQNGKAVPVYFRLPFNFRLH